MGRMSGAAALMLGVAACAAHAQQPAASPFVVGHPLGLPVVPAVDGAFRAISTNVKVYGAVYSAESCSYDTDRGVIVLPNRGVTPDVRTNDAWVSFLNHDGTVHTARWLGVQTPVERAAMTPPLVLNEPNGSDIAGGLLYVTDRSIPGAPGQPSVAMVRWFDLRTGVPVGEIRVDGVDWFNDLEVADDGTIYATRTGDRTPQRNAATWQIWKITPDGVASVFAQGAPLDQPNGIAFDPEGNIVVNNVGDDAVVTFSPAGRVLKTEHAAQPYSDGLVILPDGTKYVSSVGNGGISRIRPGQPAELIATNIPNPASMCLDPVANQLVIPMNANNGVAFLPLD